MRKLSALITAAVAAGFIGVTATPAHAILNVRCIDGNGYTEIHNEKRHCFAYAGRMDVYITNVYKIASGNNNITVYVRHPSGSIQPYEMNKGEVVQWSSVRITVEDVEIH
ncbi:beta/gamma crystallin domain-containing protein [Nonomuraea sp. SBT364]|uniref:beta/gamma crystallin domain-containing protein n=1 Tax=Nonomuraea sp. SBT364 TaxID=1580530 RepID=UPI00066B51F6|nr:beta/gamma crystallin domain-containing protein [Nonomuraea sp. SBT364]